MNSIRTSSCELQSERTRLAPPGISPAETRPAIRPAPRGWVATLVVVAAATLLVYWPALRGGPLWDDDAHLTPPALRSWSGLGRIWSEPGATQQYYPLLHTAFWLEHRLWGDAVLGYHLANLAQHLLAAGLFAMLLRRLRLPGATLAAAIFALHPVHVESVAWISEQKNTLSLVFALGAALAYLRFHDSRRPWSYALGLLLFVLALLTKTVTATLPAVLLVVLWARDGGLSWRLHGRPLVPWLLLGATAGLFTAWMEHHVIGAAGPAFALGWAQRWLLAGRVVWFYAVKLLWPAGLVFVYPRWTLAPGVAWQWLPLAGAVVVAVILWRLRTVSRVPLAALLVFGGTLVPVLGFLDVYPFQFSFVADHFQYLPSLPLIAAFAAGLTLATRNLRPRPRQALAIAGLAGMALLASRQTPMYRSSQSLYQATLQRNPECWLAHNNLGLLLSARGQRREALIHFRQAVQLNPDYFDGHNNLGLTLTQAGHPLPALAHLRRAIELRPSAAQARNNLGIALAAAGRGHEAVATFRAALRFMPDSPHLHDNLAKALRLIGRSDEAAASAAEAGRLRERSRRAAGNPGSPPR